uniref:3-oxo-5-alpha-steroid 4-dehydrogenase C-terminal domain-containing protein n=1 Tax=Hucho hucho TaxID=62062 RepID=A0A4W5NQ01_9TELE
FQFRLSKIFASEAEELYSTSRYGFPINVKFAWFVQELPAFLVPLCLMLWTSAAKTTHLSNQLLLVDDLSILFCGGKSTSFALFVLAFVFCIYNGYMQFRYMSNWVTSPCFITGSVLGLVGWLVNVHSGHILTNLRKPEETGYKKLYQQCFLFFPIILCVLIPAFFCLSVSSVSCQVLPACFTLLLLSSLFF